MGCRAGSNNKCNIFSEFARRIPCVKELYFSLLGNDPLRELLVYRKAHPTIVQGILSKDEEGEAPPAEVLYGDSPRVTKRQRVFPTPSNLGI